MVGVWDTVGALGIPSAIGQVDPDRLWLSRHQSASEYKERHHALAMDERRAQFPPTLWKGPAVPGQTLEQVWFTGAHSDVGGGEPDDLPGTTALSDITLGWMMSKASALGLTFDPGLFRMPALTPALALDTFHESWKDLLRHSRAGVSIAQDASISNSVAIRCADDSAWRPENQKFADPKGGSLLASYQMVSVVKPLEAVATAGGGD